MLVLFSRRTIIAGRIYNPGDTADIDTDIAVDLLDRSLASFLGDGDRHTSSWTDLLQPASGINPAGAVAPPSIDQDLNEFAGSLLFSGALNNVLAGQWQLPHEWQEGTPIRPHIHWMLTADSAAAVAWVLRYRVGGIGQAAGEWSESVPGVLSVSHGGVKDVHAISTFGEIAMTGNLVSVVVFWQLERLGSTDANGDDARVISIDAHYLKDSSGSATEYAK